MPHRRDDFINLLFGKPQTPQNIFRHICTDFFVPVKMNRTSLQILFRRHRLGDVMQQYRPRQ